jgi:excisionase family DNA binding protein
VLPNHIPNATLLSRKEAAQYLGVSASTLANWASTRTFVIPFFRVGKAVRYRKSDLDAFIENSKDT